MQPCDLPLRVLPSISCLECKPCDRRECQSGKTCLALQNFRHRWRVIAREHSLTDMQNWPKTPFHMSSPNLVPSLPKGEVERDRGRGLARFLSLPSSDLRCATVHRPLVTNHHNRSLRNLIWRYLAVKSPCDLRERAQAMSHLPPP